MKIYGGEKQSMKKSYRFKYGVDGVLILLGFHMELKFKNRVTWGRWCSDIARVPYGVSLCKYHKWMDQLM